MCPLGTGPLVTTRSASTEVPDARLLRTMTTLSEGWRRMVGAALPLLLMTESLKSGPIISAGCNFVSDREIAGLEETSAAHRRDA